MLPKIFAQPQHTSWPACTGCDLKAEMNCRYFFLLIKFHWIRQTNDGVFVCPFKRRTASAFAYCRKKNMRTTAIQWHFYFNSIFARVFGNSTGKWLQFIKKIILLRDSNRSTNAPNNHRLRQLQNQIKMVNMYSASKWKCTRILIYRKKAANVVSNVSLTLLGSWPGFVRLNLIFSRSNTFFCINKIVKCQWTYLSLTTRWI